MAVLGRPCCVVMSRRDEHTIQWRKAEHAKKRKNARAPRLVPDAWPRTDAWRLRGATMVGGEGGRGGLLGITMLRQASLCSVRHHYAPSGITVLLFFFFFSQMCHSTHHSWPARFSFDSRVAPSAAVCMRSTWRTSAPAASGSARATMLRLRRRVRMLLLRTIRRVTMTTLMMTLMMTLTIRMTNPPRAKRRTATARTTARTTARIRTIQMRPIPSQQKRVRMRLQTSRPLTIPTRTMTQTMTTTR